MVSIVIPTHNRPDSLRRCLAAIPHEPAGMSSAQVIVVDDGSHPGVRATNLEICGEFGAEYLENNPAAGPASARNRGIEKASAAWVAFLDDDVVPAVGWMQALSDTIANVSETVAGIEGSIASSGDGLWDREVENASGGLYASCNIAYRTDHLRCVGGFDERFRGPFCEDQELALRMLVNGEIIYCQGMAVSHAPRSNHPWRFVRGAPQRIRALLFSELYFYEKWPREYRRFRSCSNFWGTYRAVITRHLWTTFNRRGLGAVVRHPVQACALFCASVIEQIMAIVYGSELLAAAEKQGQSS